MNSEDRYKHAPTDGSEYCCVWEQKGAFGTLFNFREEQPEGKEWNVALASTPISQWTNESTAPNQSRSVQKVGGINGEPIPETHLWRFPRKIFTIGAKPPTRKVDFNGSYCSQRVKDIIETFDPGMHQFFPIEIIHKKSGQPVTAIGQMYFWNICRGYKITEVLDFNELHRIGALKEEYHKRYDDGSTFGILSPRINEDGLITVRPNMFSSCNIFVAREYTDKERNTYRCPCWPWWNIFISGPLHRAFAAAKITHSNYYYFQLIA